MNRSVHHLLEELLALDPSLAQHRDTLERELTAIVAAKPSTRFREEFKRDLLADLRTRMVREPVHSLSLQSIMQRFAFFGSGAVVGAFALFLVTMGPDLMKTTSSRQSVPEAGITTVGERAFGDLSQTPSTASRPQSGGGGGGMGMGGDAAVSNMAYGDEDMKMIMPAPDFEVLTFRYDGDLELPSGDVQVMRRTRGNGLSAANSGFANSPLGNLIDLGRLGNMNVQQVTMTTPGQGGYSVSIDYVDGSIWINKNYTPAQRPEWNCRDEACFQRYRLTESDMLSEEELISIAKDALADLGVDVSAYGDPVVQDDWRVWLARAEDRSMFYFPESQNVTFPYLINGKPVYEEYGNAYGVNVGIDIRRKEMTSVGLRTNALEASDYAVTDLESFKKALAQGGQQSWMPPEAKTVEATLGAPVEAYVHVYQWNEQTGQQTELFAPAMVFDVTENPSTMNTRERVIVPLAKDLVDRVLTTNPVDGPILY